MTIPRWDGLKDFHTDTLSPPKYRFNDHPTLGWIERDSILRVHDIFWRVSMTIPRWDGLKEVCLGDVCPSEIGC